MRVRVRVLGVPVLAVDVDRDEPEGCDKPGDFLTGLVVHAEDSGEEYTAPLRIGF